VDRPRFLISNHGKHRANGWRVRSRLEQEPRSFSIRVGRHPADFPSAVGALRQSQTSPHRILLRPGFSRVSGEIGRIRTNATVPPVAFPSGSFPSAIERRQEIGLRRPRGRASNEVLGPDELCRKAGFPSRDPPTSVGN